MAKDAGGHGSVGRGSNMSAPDQHQHRILRDTVRNPLKGQFLGGPNAHDAEATLRSKFGYNDMAISRLKSDAGQPAAHQAGVEAVRDTPRAALTQSFSDIHAALGKGFNAPSRQVRSKADLTGRASYWGRN